MHKQQDRGILAPGGIGNFNHKKRRLADPRLRPRDHRDRKTEHLNIYKLTFTIGSDYFAKLRFQRSFFALRS
jgi:hypothetical protein